MDPQRSDDIDELNQATVAFLGVRPRLFGIAYRMLGTAAEAEDIVQEVWLRWQSTDRSVVRDATALLVTTTVRLAINLAQSARSRHETYIGPWLPEPVDTAADPTLGAERGEALELAVLILLEKLLPNERAAYVLREAFDYSYSDIADILQLTESNTRQLVTRARKHITDERRAQVSSSEHRRLLEAFLAAAQKADISALKEIFTEDIVSITDGGGILGAARIPVLGRERVAKFIATFSSRFWADWTVTRVQVNGQPAALIRNKGIAYALVAIDVSPQGIGQILWVMSPAKLAVISQASSQSL
ncbi:RNA polymerase sigma-70 factor [Alloacidobacterium dinghuense]|uniref:RNA polymerase sigma-70 factor n=1 Tax=Alloacidobacterium dinghuense TaxID=2763107 RepID=A0A7G8BEF9_9BACT|nr:RNA polymerase sigma-70 factor [Alloacidobacterium dinghuense]QNI30929.1 RNA polymerase sigma-70 factor [Alloacidobacterium dinghuense]